jgi:hypothetical protein
MSGVLRYSCVLVSSLLLSSGRAMHLKVLLSSCSVMHLNALHKGLASFLR